MKKLIQISRIFIGSILFLFSLLGILFGIIAIFDPIGSQMSDDGNPFGTPPTFFESFSKLFVFSVIFIISILLIFGFDKIRNLFVKKLR